MMAPIITRKVCLSFFFAVITMLGISAIISPFVISIDSIYGFLAYKGTLLSHSFNVVREVSASNINDTNDLFVSWWSPGQWVFPATLIHLFGIRPGVSSILVTVLFSISGFIGFYKLFTHLKFTPQVTFLSLLMILSGCDFYYSFIIYQGGEILEFGIFPWFVLYVLKIKKITFLTILKVSGLFLFCFFCKTTLVLYCGLFIFFILCRHEVSRFLNTKRVSISTGSVFLVVALTFCMALIHFLFLSRGLTPTVFHQYHFDAKDFLVPLSSPLSSNLSIQQSVTRLEKLFYNNNQPTESSALISSGLYLILCAGAVVSVIAIFRNKLMDTGYKYSLLLLFSMVSVFFMVAYLWNTNIDYSSRHFKLLGYYFVPGLVTVLSMRVKESILYLAALVFFFVAVADFAYLKQKWAGNRYISRNFFYRNINDLSKIDRLDESTYQQLISIDRKTTGNSPFIYFVEGNIDIAMDLKNLCIMQDPFNPPFEKIYKGAGAPVICCLSKQSSGQYPRYLERKFPDYHSFYLLHQTENYLFILAVSSSAGPKSQ